MEITAGLELCKEYYNKLLTFIFLSLSTNINHYVKGFEAEDYTGWMPLLSPINSVNAVKNKTSNDDSNNNFIPDASVASYAPVQSSAASQASQ